MATEIHISRFSDLVVEVNAFGDTVDPFMTIRLKADADDVKLFVGVERGRQIAAAILDALDAATPRCQGVCCSSPATVTLTWYNPERDQALDRVYCQQHADRIGEVRIGGLECTTSPIATAAS